MKFYSSFIDSKIARCVINKSYRTKITLYAAALLAAIGWTSLARTDHSQPSIDPVRAWNEQALATVRAKSASDAQAPLVSVR